MKQSLRTPASTSHPSPAPSTTSRLSTSRGFPLTLERPKPNKESLESIRVANEIARNGEPTYASAKEMLEAMECRHSKGRVHRKAPSRRKAPQEETLRPRTA